MAYWTIRRQTKLAVRVVFEISEKDYTIFVQ